MSLVGLIEDVHHTLETVELPHAFGGALALAYIAEPRGTVDVDVNVFVPLADLGRVREALAVLGLAAGAADAPVGGVRFTADHPFPVDVFVNLDERYAEIQRRVVHHPFGSLRRVPFLAAQDLALFKLSFGRPQDWVDLEAIARSEPALDVDAIEELLVALRGPSMYPRLVRFRRYFP